MLFQLCKLFFLLCNIKEDGNGPNFAILFYAQHFFFSLSEKIFHTGL